MAKRNRLRARSCRPIRASPSRTASRRSSRCASAILGAVALAVFAVLFLRLWALQVLSGDRYLNAAQENQVRTVRVEAPRGSILDRNGHVLVSNVPGTAVRIWKSDLPKEGRYAMFKRLSKVLRVPLPQLTKALEDSKDDPLTPITIKTAVHEDQVMYLTERVAEFPGVQIVGTYLRDYEHRALAAQILGYVGEISPEELADAQARGLPRPATSSARPVSSAPSTSTCAARPARPRCGSTRSGRPQSEYETKEYPTYGRSVRLTIDVGLQQAAERALAYGIQTARNNESYNANGGAIVALDPSDGAILAMASNPTYKPSVYVGRVDPKKLEPLVDDKVAKERNYPGPEPGARRPVSARLDVQAGHRARRDLRRPPLAVPVDPVHADPRTTASTSSSSRTGTRTRTCR